ncbi:HSP20 family protein [Paucibacter oligotrophus]|uniref:HSP20 family protein n=1 Tax=Roseateles oligotrophus TaxID=1769250 RepID=A0A840LB07_9BURK|nr:Hsp20/alpha crystallin family protein [Roseateles oligotrophus]MBB4844921.1 HSP20 family protein [Roseateles oligotrophus]
MFVFPVHASARQAQARQASDIAQRIERIFQGAESALALRSPALDVSETDTAYILQLDMPGVDKTAVKISIEGRRVNIDAEQADPAETEAVASPRQLYRERALTRFSRSIALPQEVNQGDSTARLESGVLTLTLVKRQATGPSHLTVS